MSHLFLNDAQHVEFVLLEVIKTQIVRRRENERNVKRIWRRTTDISCNGIRAISNWERRKGKYRVLIFSRALCNIWAYS
jgi:hypothetical protein